MKVILTSILFIFSLFSGYSQEIATKDSLTTNSNIEIVKDWRINQLNDTYKKSHHLKGYRVQLYSGNKRQPARTVKAKFISSYRKVKAHEIYQQPFFKIRVGDFRTKLEALKFQKEIIEDFPNSFIVKDEIDIDELVKTN